MSHYTVRCSCPTPLENNPFHCEAESEDEAVSKFYAANGITGTDHPISVIPAELVEVSEVAKGKKDRKKHEPQSASGNQG